MINDHVRRIERASLSLVSTLDRDPLVGRVIRGDASREEYVEFLSATYHYLRWSGPLLAEAAAGLRRSGRCPCLLDLLDAKVDEESPHVRWVLDDLAACGANVERVVAAAAPVAVDAYVRWSQANADAGSPAFIGAAYALEFISMHRAKMAADNLRARGAIPGIARAVSFLVGHGDADTGHIETLNGILRLVEDPGDRSAIVLSAQVLCTLYPGFFRAAPASGSGARIAA